MELFSEEDRLSLIYGKNGSGKSTISKAIHKAKGDTVEDIERADLYDGEIRHILIYKVFMYLMKIM